MAVGEMRALVLARYGGADAAELRQVARPQVEADQVLVQVHAVGLNPVDYKIRQGELRILYRFRLPCVLGNELAGVVTEIGAAVTRFKQGDRVMARVAKHRMGAFAEYAAVEESFVAHVPDDVPLDVAAGVPLAGLTAMQILRDELAVSAAQKVLVTGGAGGVGTFAIQLAKAFGCPVITTASPRGAALVTSLGADLVLDYTSGELERLHAEVDAVFDTVGGTGLDAAIRAAKPGAKLVTVNGPVEPKTALVDLKRGLLLATLFWLVSFRIRRLARRHGVKYRYFFMHPSGDDLAQLAAMLEAGELRVIIDRVFPFEQITDALAYLQGGRAKGKVVVRLREEMRG